jgi:hypothetical protein
VAARAKKLGMVPASSPAFLRLGDGKVLGNPEVADPADAVQIVPAPQAKPQSLRPRLVIAEAPRASRAEADGSRTNGDSEAAGARTSTGRAR